MSIPSTTDRVTMHTSSASNLRIEQQTESNILEAMK